MNGAVLALLFTMASANEYIRADGVRITHDPYAPGMLEKYGRPGETDNEGFDPYKDTVGPGIYGGIVKRDSNGKVGCAPSSSRRKPYDFTHTHSFLKVIYGEQYQRHNPRPGPIYAGGGYTPMSNALRGGEAPLKALLDKYPDLVNEISTGGATPLHMCGMGRDNERSTQYIIDRGGEIEVNIKTLTTFRVKPLSQ